MKHLNFITGLLFLMLLSGCQDDIVPPSTEQAINSTQKSALWFKNANNPYETLVGDNIIAAIDSANSKGLSSTCSANNEEDAIIEWFDVVSNVYHDAVTYPIDTSLIVITSAERDYLDQITMELYSDNDLNNILNRLILIEDDLVNAYATKYPSRSKELESMLHLTSTIKHLRYGYAQIGIKPCPKLKFFSTSAIVS